MGTARSRPVGVPGPEAKRADPGLGTAAFNRGGWKSGAGATAGSLAVPPALRHPARPTHTANVSPSPGTGSGGQGPAPGAFPGAFPGAVAQRPAPSADRSGPILGSPGEVLAGNSVGADPLGARRGAVRQISFQHIPEL